ncbi:hypothetical protein SALCHL_004457 [Streptomyces albus subsp. chlorinus]|uniref:hypothetical protein n=1 Tax=Streptomyces albus TaxID=1888 RepID=UPI003D09F2A0
MAALAWLLIPVVAAVAASLWGSWAGRRRVKTPDAAGVAGYERFRAAMERSSAGGPAGPVPHRGAAVTAAVPAHAPARGAAGDGSRPAARPPEESAELAPAGALVHAAPDGPARSAD